MRRRLLVAKALVHRPPVVILDEPTAGVDVELRRSLWAYMRELNGKGVTVVLTTHYLEEAEELCDRIAIIDRGRSSPATPRRTLMRRLDEKELVLTLDAALHRHPGALAAWDCTPRPDRPPGHPLPPEPGRGRPRSSTRSAAPGLVIGDLATREADLEELFLRLTGHAPEPAPGTVPAETAVEVIP